MYEILKEWAVIAPGFTPIVALIAALVAWRQLRLNRINQRETTAKGVFREYLKLAFDNPDLARGDRSKLARERLEKYEWFVAYMLWATEELLEFAKKDPVWCDNMRCHLLPHKEFFKTDEGFKRELPSYSDDVQALVNRVKNTA
ncbi:hypothetical protein ACFFWD_10420 [Bradyrhizobium erythrophlei]|uniref:hypothetical protein n=1 Tax=Bradyrhizobium erythrophlei TaxID=1437360 RepID=UPI0035ECB2DA